MKCHLCEKDCEDYGRFVDHMENIHRDQIFQCPCGPAAGKPGLAYWRPDKTCSFCGSLSGEEALRRIAAHEQVGPTDKNYKLYIGASGKLYFDHLDQAQKNRFVELANDGTMKIGYPGRFYVKPYFVEAVPQE